MIGSIGGLAGAHFTHFMVVEHELAMRAVVAGLWGSHFAPLYGHK